MDLIEEGLELYNKLQSNIIKTYVSKIGKLEDYLHLPFTHNELPIGVVTEVIELEDAYELTVIMFKNKIWNSILTDNKSGIMKSISIDFIDMHNKKLNNL